MMKTVLMSAIALGAMAVAASAADMPARGPAVAPAPYLAPVFTWTGFYLGVNVGAAWNGNDNCPGYYDYTSSTGLVGSRVSAFGPACNSDDTAFTAGIQGGFNWQMGAVVFGIEGDVNWLGNDNKLGFNGYSYGGNYYSLEASPRSNMLGGLRGRLGWSFDRALLYMTGGAAFRNSTNSDSVYVYSAPVNGTLLATYSTNSDRNNVGWSLGGGLEWAFTNNVSLKVEYLHTQFDRGHGVYVTSTSGYTGHVFRNDNSTDSIDVVRFGINYRFGGPVAPAPVLARY